MIIFSPKVLSSSLAIVLGYSSLAAIGVGASSSKTKKINSQNLRPAHHPPVRNLQSDPLHPVLANFANQFRCPYAKEWLVKGPHKAAIDLGLMTPNKIDAALMNGEGNHYGRRRRAQGMNSQMTAVGGCSYNSQWSGPSCIEFRGEGWIENVSMIERCNLESESTFTEGQGCPAPSELAGWCVQETAGSDEENAFEASSMMITGMSPDCKSNKMACETFIGGTWEGVGSCSTDSGGDTDYTNMVPPPSTGDGTCLLAPGVMGAAHQSGFSKGYSATCPGTPAEGSPYMWPLAWSAETDSQAMQFGVDDVVWREKGRVFYRLDKNWKRLDTTYSKGDLRFIRDPCDDPHESMKVCIKNDDVANGDPLKTMLHLGSKMYFITWKTNADVKVGETDPSLIDDCKYMDFKVIGNVRPDWFLDDRGDDTDVQYIGDQHVYYANGDVPRLVKQWRKKDFASQYFTMSVSGNPRSNKLVLEDATVAEEDKIHWPLILNIPGEGFGDDMLQVFQNHSLLTDEDDDLFLLVENLESSGGSCPLLSAEDWDPPTPDDTLLSNLKVDPNSWYSNLYTFSPIWQPPMTENDINSDSKGDESMVVAVTEKDRARVESCYDPSSKSVKLSVEWQNVDIIATETGSQLPWMALGYRINEKCVMNPPDGSESDIVVVSQMPNESFPKAYAGSLKAGAKSQSSTIIDSIYSSFRPLASTIGYSNVSLSAPMLSNSDVQIARSSDPTSVTLSFTQEFDKKPEVMHLMYAIGMSPQLGFHINRACFDVVEFPTCSASTSASGEDRSNDPKENESSPSSVLSTSLVGITAVVSSIFLAM